ncbi:MAG TPA: DUF3971 domain-containing protein [Caulobacteraceae bacterium]|jgi:hypothetical protein|nr:DUF3971 domain-containing protein [Caulobacteraceae bacterium]
MLNFPSAQSFRQALHNRRVVLVAALTVLLVAVIGVSLRVAAGPMPAQWLRPAVEKALASQVEGGKAHVDRISLAWFQPETSFGLELDGVSLTDGKGRTILQARHLDGGFAFDGLLSLTPALGRVAADDFFAAVSVSPKGKYALGYDAEGEALGPSHSLVQDLNDLVGREKFARPDSFLRRIDLENGRIAFHQVKGPVDWVAQVKTLRWQKLDGKLMTRADATVTDTRTARQAVLNLQGNALVGLRGATASGQLQGLVPALVFPSVGSTASLSTLDAQVDGHGSVSYDLESGIRSADLTLTAGRGAWRSNGQVQAFNSAQAVAAYNPSSGALELTALKLDAQYTQLDLTGRFKLTPEDKPHEHPAHVDFMIDGPKIFATLADDEAPQQVNNVSVIGRYTPDARKLDLQRVYAQMGTTPLGAAVVFTGDDRERIGVKLTARVGGSVTPQQVLAFWPRKVAGPVREWLKGSVLSAQLINATFKVEADPGEFSRPKLNDEDLNIGFDFRDAALRFAPGLTPISAGVGHAVVQGNRFDLSLSSGRVDNVALSEGTVEIPQFKPDGGLGIFKARAVGDAHEIMAFLDKPPLHLFSPNGFSPDRVSGQADLHFEVDRPMLFEVPAKDYRVNYQAVIHNGGLKDAALGWDLTGGELKVDGDQDKVTVAGAGLVGPYKGKIDFATRYQGPRLDHSMTVDVDGLLQASILGGKRGLATPLAGKFRIEGADGGGTVHSPVFDGRVAWKGGNGPDRLIVEGNGSGPALRKIGAPFVSNSPDRFPASLHLARAGDVWRGPFHADVIQAGVLWQPGAQRNRLVVQADVSPTQARRLGFGAFPLFNQTRQVVVDANFAGDQGTALVRAASLNVGVAWNDAAPGGPERTLRTNMTAAELSLLGIPPAIAPPGRPLAVSATWKDTNDGIAGSADVDAIPLKFQTAAGKNNSTVFTVHADLDPASLRRLGAPDLVDITGTTGLSARWATVQKASAGRIDFDFSRATLAMPHTDWSKPSGQAALLSVDFVANGEGPVRLSRISGEGPAMDVQGSGQLAPNGTIASLDFSRARLNGLIDAAVRVTHDAQGENLVVKGKWLDVRRMIADLTENATASGGASAPAEAMRIEADVEGLRFSDGLPLKQTSIRGVWGAPAQRRLDVTATLAGGARLWGRLYPSDGTTAVLAQTTNAGEAAQTLFNIMTLRGGTATLNGKLVDGGADLNLVVKNVRMVKAPTMRQILTEASLKTVNDTLNNEGVLFTNVVAPVKLRDHRILVGESRATGPSLGVTAKGVADLQKGTFDVEGNMAPVYGLNGAIGHVPVIGQLLTSRKGEGVVGIAYRAKGPFDKPQISVNPLSLMTPGILRRLFESNTPSQAPAPPPPKAKKPTAEASTAGAAG